MSKPFSLACTVSTAQRDGILIAHGGAAVGYALHLRGGKLVFFVHGSQNQEVIAEMPPSTKPQRITASMAKNGTMNLQINDLPALSAKGGSLIKRQPQEDFCIGHDNSVPVTEYTTRNPLKEPSQK